MILNVIIQIILSQDNDGFISNSIEKNSGGKNTNGLPFVGREVKTI